MTSNIFLGCVSIWMVLSCKPGSSLNRSFQVTIIKSVKKVLLNVSEALLSELQRMDSVFVSKITWKRYLKYTYPNLNIRKDVHF